ncbi:MAG: hypothetical protein IK990_12180 [Ruminiclostridium sp.]|nr:hypothetical protein [Ruminiclostridium sp.]
MENDVFTEKQQRFIDMVKAHKTPQDTECDMEVIIFPCILLEDDEEENPIFDEVYDYVEAHPEASVRQLQDYVVSLLPPIEIVDDDDFDDGESA